MAVLKVNLINEKTSRTSQGITAISLNAKSKLKACFSLEALVNDEFTLGQKFYLDNKILKRRKPC